MKQLFLMRITYIYIALFAFSITADAASFIPLGDLPGGEYHSEAIAISGDGEVVYGVSRSTQAGSPESFSTVFRWTRDGGMQMLDGFVYEYASDNGIYPDIEYTVRDATYDGNFIVGSRYSAGLPSMYRWQSPDQITLSPFSGSKDTHVSGNAISDNGNIVVGISGVIAVGWDVTNNSSFKIGYEGSFQNPPGLTCNIGDGVSVWDITGDGTSVVGSSSCINIDTNEYINTTAIVWLRDNNARLLTVPDSDVVSSDGISISDDGLHVAGEVYVGHSLAAKWTLNETIEFELIGDLPGGNTSSKPTAISNDGSIVIGRGVSDLGYEAFIWTPDSGIRGLREVFKTDYGLDLNGWHLSQATDMTPDGSIIIGYGINPDGNTEGWIAYVDKPTTSITIDIKPSKKSGKPNEIDLKKDKNLKVAIVGSAEFDALQVNPSTVKFGPNEASPSRYRGQDFNRDGYSDLVLTFKLKDTGIGCGDTETTLTGQTFPDPVIDITGSDTFIVEPCP